MKSVYLCERLNLYQLIMQTMFVTNVSHIKLQNENYIMTTNKKTSSEYIVGYIPKCFDTCCQPQHPMSKHLND
jgi:hypothetical protein